MLISSKTFLAMFRFNFATEMWNSTTDLKSWKLMPYPRPSDELSLGSSISNTDRMSVDRRPMAYYIDLHYPIKARNVPMVKMCLEIGANVNIIALMRTPLSMAVADAYNFDHLETAAAFLAARRDSRKIIQLLLDYGADPLQLNERGMSAQEIAKQVTHSIWWPATISTSEKRRLFRPGYTIVDHTNIRADWLIFQLLQSEPDENLPRLISMTDAVWDGDLHALEAILNEHPTLCHIANSHGVSALGIAVLRGDETIVNVLLENGASPNSPDPSGFTPLAIALYERKDMVPFLLQHGASATISAPILGLKPLEICASEGELAVCQSILEQLDVQSPTNETKCSLTKALFLAIDGSHNDLVRMLLNHGADPHQSISIRMYGGRVCDISPYKYVQCAFPGTIVNDTKAWHSLGLIFQEYDSRSSGSRRYRLIDV